MCELSVNVRDQSHLVGYSVWHVKVNYARTSKAPHFIINEDFSACGSTQNKPIIADCEET